MKGAKQPAGHRPETDMQDYFVNGKISGLEFPVARTQAMSTPITRSDEYVHKEALIPLQRNRPLGHRWILVYAATQRCSQM